MSSLWLDKRALAVVEQEAVKRRFLETGGALFGYETTEELVVACAFGPGRHARHRPRSFTPHRATTAALIRLVWEASEARYRFLGSWHTHPRGSALPSNVDTRTAAEMAAQVNLRLPRPLVLIQATHGHHRRVTRGELRAWQWNDKPERMTPVAVETIELPERYCPMVCAVAALGV